MAADSEWVNDSFPIVSRDAHCWNHIEYILYIYVTLERSGVSEVEDKMQVRPTSVAMATGSNVAVTVPRVAHFASCAVIRRVSQLYNIFPEINVVRSGLVLALVL